MNVVNQSLVPADRLASIIRFLKARFPQAKSTHVLLTSERDPQAPGAAFMTGDAFPSGGWAQGLRERHFVRVYIPTLQRPYPTSQQNPAGDYLGDCPRVMLNSWEDELVLVLGHELAHVTQYEEQGPTVGVATIVADTDERFEVQAERAGAVALTLWHGRQASARRVSA